MAKKAKISKVKAVRDYVKAHPDATGSEISAALARKRIVIAANRASYISNLPLKAVRTAIKEVAASRGIGLPKIKVAISLLSLVGGMEKAKRALAAAEGVTKGAVANPEVRLASALLEMAGGIDAAHAALAAAQEARAML